MLSFFFSFIIMIGCKTDDPKRGVDPDPENKDSVIVEQFYYGADLSYVNQILDHNGQYLDEGEVRDPYRIFKDHGANLARFRIWHNPKWTQEVYGDEGTQLYNDLLDVERSIRLAKAQGLSVLLDFHYSDTWADPGSQQVPAAWRDITEIGVLADSVYDYTFQTLTYLNQKGLMPEFVQIGNETNCGMMLTGAVDGFPSCNVCDDGWANMGAVLNSGIQAVRAVSADSDIKTKVMLHVADPVNVDWWFEGATSVGGVTDFEFIGFSYYPIWHTGISLDRLGETVSGFVTKFKREVIILETAYPWTTEGDDNYNNLFGGESPLTGYPYTQDGQLSLMKRITQTLISAGASGVIYWEPAWISSEMKDKWGTGSSWENNTFFDFDGNTIPAIDYMNYEYDTND
ncbi:glycoside hydrolase family 53 protein [Marinoscillum sp.]|uniref:glycoside hydrolase family 53 protein n=1 Tax=Marinoscillum sp. TaxID=2024838 RepID=UPI003BAC15E8